MFFVRSLEFLQSMEISSQVFQIGKRKMSGVFWAMCMKPDYGNDALFKENSGSSGGGSKL